MSAGTVIIKVPINSYWIMFHTELWRGEDEFCVHIFLTTKAIRRLMKNGDLPRPRHRTKLRDWMFKLRSDAEATKIFMFLRGIK
jgi:hypothetical protein